jgi:hypothetical protein
MEFSLLLSTVNILQSYVLEHLRSEHFLVTQAISTSVDIVCSCKSREDSNPLHSDIVCVRG